MAELKGFHNFCLSRMIPLEIEIEFTVFFSDYFKSFKKDKDLDDILEFLLGNMSFDEILQYWLIFIKDKSNILPLDE